MPNVMVLAAPYAPPPPPEQPWVSTKLIWTGWDGTTWDLNDGQSGVQVVSSGVVGLHLPPFEPQVSDRRTGRRRRGVRVRERQVELPLLVWHDESSAEWVERDRAFWRSFHPLRTGTLTVTTPGGVIRHLDVYLESDGGHAYDLDPVKKGWGLYNLVLTAEQPYWYGEPITRSWGALETGLFFGGDDPDDPGAVETAPPLFITSDSDTSNAFMPNPGDVAAWPVWTVEAAGSDVDITFGAVAASIGPPTIPDGQTLVVDTDPTIATARLNGVDVAGQVDPYNPKPIPAYSGSYLIITITGLGVVTVTITPRYLRAW